MPTLQGFLSQGNLQLQQSERQASIEYCASVCDYIVLLPGWSCCSDHMMESCKNNNYKYPQI